MSHLIEPPAVSSSLYIDCNTSVHQIVSLFSLSILCSGVSSSTSITKTFVCLMYNYKCKHIFMFGVFYYNIFIFLFNTLNKI